MRPNLPRLWPVTGEKCPKELSDLSDMVGSAAGQRCFIVGAGPSLRELKLGGIWQDVVITVNSSILLCPWLKQGDANRRFWVSNDSSVMAWDYWKRVVAADCTRIVRTSWWPLREAFVDVPVRYFRTRDTRKDVPLSPYVQSKALLGISSVVTALDFAILLGCSPIYLLGVDHDFVGGRSHFWQFWPISRQPRRFGKSSPNSAKEQREVFERNIACFKSLNTLAGESGIRIFNCSPISKVSTFHFCPLP